MYRKLIIGGVIVLLLVLAWRWTCMKQVIKPTTTEQKQ